LLESFLSTFGPKGYPAVGRLTVVEQSLPGRLEVPEGGKISRGLPDALIFDDDGWALVIESKIAGALTEDQLRRHHKTVERCGFDTIEDA
jgi:hypothetical protein